MINVKNPKLENMVKELLMKSRFSSFSEYLSCRMQHDLKLIRSGRRPPGF